MSRYEVLLSNKETKDALSWWNSHRCKKNDEMHITLTATGIGRKIIVACASCKREKDVSDYDSW